MKIFRPFLIISFLILLQFVFPATGLTHDGPAFPILVNQKVDAISLSIWADPDTGEGSYFLYLEGPESSSYSITVLSTATDNPSEKLLQSAILTEKEDGKSSYKAIVPYTRAIMWNVEFQLKQNGNTQKSIIIPIEVTPPGPNKLEFAVYFLPFILVGFLWVKVVLAKRKKS